jgi:hypothetical protein
MNLVLPIIHLNGSSKQALVEQRVACAQALRNAGDALAAMSPNGRDYYPQPRLMEQAAAQHRRRAETLNALLTEIEQEMLAIDREE